MKKFQYNNHSIGQNSFHLIWCPKYRYRVLKIVEINKVCEGILRLVARQQGYKIYELKVMEDHIHMFVEFSPHISISKVFQEFKGVSSRVLRRRFSWLKKVYPKGNMWSPGKFFRSVGCVTSNVIEDYIRNSNNNYNYFKTRSYNQSLAEF